MLKKIHFSGTYADFSSSTCDSVYYISTDTTKNYKNEAVAISK